VWPPLTPDSQIFVRGHGIIADYVILGHVRPGDDTAKSMVVDGFGGVTIVGRRYQMIRMDRVWVEIRGEDDCRLGYACATRRTSGGSATAV
jgi:hypothetical protein